jgi:GAF domain-containing protein
MTADGGPAAENTRLRAALREAEEQQAATGEILRVISTSPTDAQPVFDAVVESAVRLCEARFGAVFVLRNGLLELAAHHNFDETRLVSLRAQYPMAPSRGYVSGRTILTGATVQIPDIFGDEEFRGGGAARAERTGFRSLLGVPMLRGGRAIGAVVIYRTESGEFSTKHVELLRTFADQAVIAIENVRLFTELQEKNHAVTAAHAQATEALDQQTAIAEILRVISTSPTDLQPVLDAVVTSAARFCGAPDASIFRLDGQDLRADAHHGPVAQPHGFRVPLVRGTVAGRSVLERRAVGVTDLQVEVEEFPEGSALARQMGQRATVSAPLLRVGAPIGAILLRRAEAVPFTAKQIALLETFADQAVIAIENVRLFTELQARTAALARSVDQLTALGEVGRAVSSTLDLETVLTTIVSRAVDLSRLDGGVVFEYDEVDQQFVQRAQAGTGGTLAAVRRATRIRKGEGVVGRIAVGLDHVQVADIRVAGYVGPNRENLIESGVRAILAVPIACEGQLIGCLGVTRNAPGEFAEDTI